MFLKRRNMLATLVTMVSNRAMASADQQIDITVIPKYLEEQSVPESNQYVFAYTVTMENTGSIAAQLLTRHWIITDSEGKTEEVRGPGVVGEHPHLRPGDSYQYTSGAILQTPVGSMMGSYQMRDANGDTFDAIIPAFTLSAEVVFH
jgi:ApaG protein